MATGEWTGSSRGKLGEKWGKQWGNEREIPSVGLGAPAEARGEKKILFLGNLLLQ